MTALRLFPAEPRKRKPSVTAAMTRAARAKARAWAASKGFATWEKGADYCRTCDKTIGGAVLGKCRIFCWDCLPFPGAPVRDHEYWCSDAEAEVKDCIRCGAILNDHGGGSFSRGGPFCWDCPRVDTPIMDAWLIAIRETPDLAPPWAGDRKACTCDGGSSGCLDCDCGRQTPDEPCGHAGRARP